MSAPNPFPNLRPDNHRVTSPSTNNYNCIAWAAGETHRRWWPVIGGRGWYWPPDIPRVATVQTFMQAFASMGYETCEGPDQDPGFEKIALYLSEEGIPTHMARQLSSGAWTSKLGFEQDIEHSTLTAVEAPIYGRAAIFLRRPSNPRGTV